VAQSTINYCQHYLLANGPSWLKDRRRGIFVVVVPSLRHGIGTHRSIMHLLYHTIPYHDTTVAPTSKKTHTITTNDANIFLRGWVSLPIALFTS
jgi:hypothetical protein